MMIINILYGVLTMRKALKVLACRMTTPLVANCHFPHYIYMKLRLRGEEATELGRD